MKRSLKKRLRARDPVAWDNAERVDAFFSVNRAPKSTFASVANAKPVTADSVLAEIADLTRTLGDRRRDDISAMRLTGIVPPWLRGVRDEADLRGRVWDRFDAHGYRPHLVSGTRTYGHFVVHALAFIPPDVLRAVREEIADQLPAWLVVDVTATDCGHEDCHECDELAAACYASTHRRAA